MQFTIFFDHKYTVNYKLLVVLTKILSKSITILEIFQIIVFKCSQT